MAFRNSGAEISLWELAICPSLNVSLNAFLSRDGHFWQKVGTKQTWHLDLETVRKLSGCTRLCDNFKSYISLKTHLVKVRDSSAFLLLLLISIHLFCCCKIEKFEACQKVKGNENTEEHSAVLLDIFQCPHILGLKGSLGNSSALGIVVSSRTMPLNTSSTLNHGW